jgi:uncharacterized peroxidase-related enzyme
MAGEYKLTLGARTLEDAEPRARELLEQSKKNLGMVPNMYGAMANSPGLLSTYLHGYEYFRKDSGFTPQEQEVVFLTISREHSCHYCVAAHSTLADKMSKVPVEVTDAIRDGKQVPDQKLGALHRFTQAMVQSRGFPKQADVQAFLAAGYNERQILEIVLALAVKTISNYSNHLFGTEVDPPFAGRTWQS